MVPATASHAHLTRAIAKQEQNTLVGIITHQKRIAKMNGRNLLLNLGSTFLYTPVSLVNQGRGHIKRVPKSVTPPHPPYLGKNIGCFVSFPYTLSRVRLPLSLFFLFFLCLNQKVFAICTRFEDKWVPGETKASTCGIENVNPA